MSEVLSTKKDVARFLGRSRRYVSDMSRAGFRLPATGGDVVKFLRKNPCPTRFRSARKSH